MFPPLGNPGSATEYVGTSVKNSIRVKKRRHKGKRGCKNEKKKVQEYKSAIGCKVKESTRVNEGKRVKDDKECRAERVFALMQFQPNWPNNKLAPPLGRIPSWEILEQPSAASSGKALRLRNLLVQIFKQSGFNMADI